MASEMLPSTVRDYFKLASNDSKLELECKLLAGEITTKDAADRIIKSLPAQFKEENYATFTYADGIRVVVNGAANIHKVCISNSFRGVPVHVQKKTRHAKGDLELPEYNLKFTLREEQDVRRDFTGAPMDPMSHVRIILRRTWLVGHLQVDFSLVKSKTRQMKTFSEILKQTPSYELELELVDRKAAIDDLMVSFKRTIRTILSAFQQTSFILPKSDTKRYNDEFAVRGIKFVNPVTLERRHLRQDRAHNILKGYTVTNKADGERCMLTVMRDKRVILIRSTGIVSWTGFTASKDVHVGDTFDGEYLSGLNLFCIFDTYAFRGKDVRMLPLMTTDEDIAARPTFSRLGCAREFLKDWALDFALSATGNRMFRIESKMFLAGDGTAMEECVAKIMSTKFEYETDGLIFTPRSSPVAPPADRRNNTWLRVYKWKPADQNSIDFMVRYNPGESYDPVLSSRVFKGMLFVSRSRNSDIIYPCETMTGEYVPPTVPVDVQRMSELQDRAPSAFQPSVPRAPNANEILIPLNAQGVPVDRNGTRVEDNTIIECSYDTDKGRWVILRTRYDKTYKLRKGDPQYGQDSAVANAIWTTIHVPITEEMIRTCASIPPDDTFEDEQYYRDDLRHKDRANKDTSSFHNKIKSELYRKVVKQGNTLLEIAMGRGGDLHKWKNSQPSRVVGFDLSQSNLDAPGQGACVRYLKEKRDNPMDRLPPALFIKGDMTTDMFAQDNRYVRILNGEDSAPTKYLEQFAGLNKFDDISCQFAIHYACTSEETFRIFAKTLQDHGKGHFFGTCLDGAAVYAFLLAKKNHVFRVNGQIVGEFTKEYEDSEGWQEEFGQTIRVLLETFETPVKEALVPFGKVTEILKEFGYELETSALFSEWYAEMSAALTPEQQEYSFLHRSFVFRRVADAVPEEKAKEEEAQEIADMPVTEEAAVAVKVKKPRKKIEKAAAVVEPAVQPIFFNLADESSGEYKFLSIEYRAPFEVNDITYPSVLHYLAWSKATQFGDTATADKILNPKAADKPKTIKTLMEGVKDANEAEWDAKKDEVMARGLRAKFVNPNNKEILAKLIATKNRPLALANPRDKYWSIGTSPDTDIAKNPAKWKGANKLGKLLEAVRKEFTPAPEVVEVE